MKKEWNNEDIDKLIKLYELNISNREIGDMLGRSESSINTKAHKLGIKKMNKSDGSKRFSEEQLTFIVKNSENLTVEEISTAIGKSKESIYSFVSDKKIKVKQSIFWWTKEQIDYLVINFHNGNKQEMCDILNKKWKTITKKARELGMLTKNADGREHNKFSFLNEEEKGYILENYLFKTYSELSRDMGRSLTAIESFCLTNNLSIKRIRKNPEDFSNELCGTLCCFM